MSTLAERQLAAWEKLAEAARVDEIPVMILRCGELMLTGEPCHKSVMILTDNHEHPYRYTHAERLAAIVLHLRNFHPALDPDPPGQQL